MPRSDIHILAVAPYESMRAAMERAAEAYPEIRLRVRTGDLEEGVEAVRGAGPDNFDCIISRGGTAQLIRRITDVPVVEIPLSVYDVLRAIKLAENYTDLYAIVGFPNITETAHILCDLLQSNVDILTVHSTREAVSTLSRLARGGYRMVVCDMVTHTAARQMGLDAFLITSGEESLRAALEQALTVSAGFRRMREENVFLRGAQGEREKTVVLDEQGGLYFSAPAEPSPEALEMLRQRLPAMRDGGSPRFYHNEQGVLYAVSAQAVSIGQRQYYQFRYMEEKIPLRSGRSGIRSYNKSECEHLLQDGIYGLRGFLGELDAAVDAAAATRQPVMIIGEPGTGKDQLARTLYLRGPLRDKPFVVLDCAAMNDKSWNFLLDHYSSPLNGSGNTISFRHMEAMSDARWRELLSAIWETGLSRRVRLLFAITCPEGRALPPQCHELVSSLGCITFRLPALRERSDEITSLASLYLANLNLEMGRQISGFDDRAMERLRAYPWPQNYAQLDRVLRELVLRTTGQYIQGAAVAEALRRERGLMEDSLPAALPLEGRTLEQITTDVILQTVAAHGGNRTAAARQLGISRSTLWRYLTRAEEME